MQTPKISVKSHNTFIFADRLNDDPKMNYYNQSQDLVEQSVSAIESQAELRNSSHYACLRLQIPKIFVKSTKSMTDLVT